MSLHGGNSLLGILFGDVLMVFAVLGCTTRAGASSRSRMFSTYQVHQGLRL